MCYLIFFCSLIHSNICCAMLNPVNDTEINFFFVIQLYSFLTNCCTCERVNRNKLLYWCSQQCSALLLLYIIYRSLFLYLRLTVKNKTIHWITIHDASAVNMVVQLHIRHAENQNPVRSSRSIQPDQIMVII